MKIFDDHIDIQSAHMKKGAADLDISGRVNWATDHPQFRSQVASPTTTTALRPELKIVAHHVPIDDALLNALPADQRAC